MIVIFFLILVLFFLFAFLIYRFSGKRKILAFDLIQFTYLFLIAPSVFIWFKTFFFFSLKSKVPAELTFSNFFIIDTMLSVIGLYLFGVLAIHSITKIFALEKKKNPQLDVFRLSEYFHLWWSHLVLYGGGLVALTVVSLLNLFHPIETSGSQIGTLIAAGLGVVFGFVLYFSAWMADPVQQKKNFMRFMKLLYVNFFLFHLFTYYLFTPTFRLEYGLYWFTFFTFLSLVSCVFIFRYSKKALYLRNLFLPPGWGENIQIFTTEESGGTR